MLKWVNIRYDIFRVNYVWGGYGNRVKFSLPWWPDDQSWPEGTQTGRGRHKVFPCQQNNLTLISTKGKITKPQSSTEWKWCFRSVIRIKSVKCVRLSIHSYYYSYKIIFPTLSLAIMQTYTCNHDTIKPVLVQSFWKTKLCVVYPETVLVFFTFLTSDCDICTSLLLFCFILFFFPFF